MCVVNLAFQIYTKIAMVPWSIMEYIYPQARAGHGRLTPLTVHHHYISPGTEGSYSRLSFCPAFYIADTYTVHAGVAE